MKKLRELLKDRTATYVEKTPEDVYREVAADPENNLSVEEVAAIGGMESSHGKFRKPIQGGSATGLFQFQPRTAEDLIKGSSENLDDFNTQAELMKALLKKNNPENLEEAYLQHNLGKRGARKFLSKDDEDMAEKAVSKAVIEGNENIYKGKKVKKIKELLKTKLEENKESANIRPSILDLFKE